MNILQKFNKFVFNRYNNFEIYRAKRAKSDYAYELTYRILDRCVVCGKYVDANGGHRLGYPSDHDGEFVCGTCIASFVEDEIAWRKP